MLNPKYKQAGSGVGSANGPARGSVREEGESSEEGALVEEQG